MSKLCSKEDYFNFCISYVFEFRFPLLIVNLIHFTDDACATPMVNIAKIVQPTATVTSMPVSGPQTGIARSIVPGQNIRSAAVGIATVPTGTATAPTAPSTLAAVNHNSSTVATTDVGAAASSAVVATAPPSPSPAKMQPTATIQRAPGGKYAALAAAAALDQTAIPPHPHPVPIAVPPVTVPPAGARGAPPPIPTKPIVPPKREPSLSRLGSITSGSAAATAIAAAAAAATAAVAATATTTTASSTSAAAAVVPATTAKHN